MTVELIATDSHGRVSLNTHGHHAQYLAREEPDGTLILQPADDLTQAELKLLSNKEIMAQLAEADAHPERAIPWKRRTPHQPVTG